MVGHRLLRRRSPPAATPRQGTAPDSGSSRIEGQVRGVEGMIDDQRYCIDVLTQISAIQAALDKVALGLLDDHARHCVIGGEAHGEPQEMTAELMAAVARLMRRG